MVEKSKAHDPGAESEDEPFLLRWSRRKHAARHEEEREPRAEERGQTPESEAGGAADTPAANEPADKPGHADEDLPPPESLGPDSDFSAYLSGRVSSGLRRAAMRRLFSLPDFNVRDGLDDYDEDYTSFQSLGKIVTAQMKHQQERLRERERVREEERQAAASDREDAKSDEATAGDAADSEMDADDDRPATGTGTAAHDHDEEPDERT